jgi:hypothetical protein
LFQVLVKNTITIKVWVGEFMNDFMDRVFGFMPYRGIFWTALGLCIFMTIIQRLFDWITNKIMFPWMEEKNQQQRKMLEQVQEKE